MTESAARFFKTADRGLFFSRGDPHDPRLGDAVRALDINGGNQELLPAMQTLKNENTFVIAGYPDDEGIRTNGGRTGAASGPDTVRKYLYKMTPPLLGYSVEDPSQSDRPGDGDPLTLLDLGNLNLTPDLLTRHHRVQAMVQTALGVDARWISIGGGHDYGFPDAAGFIEWAKTQNCRPLILNFDAHLDVRPTDRGISSGTPFYRMLEAYPDVDFAEIGIQTQCNSRKHLQWVQARGARVITQEEILVSGESFVTQVLHLLGDWILKPRPVYLSIDIDGFSSQVAPGCSQSWSTGFSPADFFATLAVLLARLDVRVLGIYEVAPPLDRDDHTSKLAAQIIHRVATHQANPSRRLT